VFIGLVGVKYPQRGTGNGGKECLVPVMIIKKIRAGPLRGLEEKGSETGGKNSLGTLTNENKGEQSSANCHAGEGT